MTKKNNKATDNKKLIYVVISVILFFAILNGTIFLVNSINISNNNNHNIAESDKPAADKIKAMAVEAIDNNPTQAEALFRTAQRQYQYIHDTTTDVPTHDAAQADIIDCQAQIWMLEHK